MRVVIARKEQAATDICCFDLVAEDGGALPSFSAGAHIDVSLAPGLMRQYSLYNPPLESHRYAIGVLKDQQSRGGSVMMHDLVVGQTLEISPPKNHFPLVHGASHSLLLAGGIGITPLLSMAEQLMAEGGSFELHYCARSPDRMAFKERFRQPDLGARAHCYFDSDGPERQIDLAALLSGPSPDRHLYVCGPGGFIDAVLATARTAGWSDATLHREYFAAAPQADTPQSSFQVEVASSGALIEVGADQTVVQALAAFGIDLLTSCEEGVCGTCLTGVLAGIPDHRDSYLTDAERAANDRFLPCCSRAKTPRLLLDI